jgi:hypothetical protein
LSEVLCIINENIEGWCRRHISLLASSLRTQIHPVFPEVMIYNQNVWKFYFWTSVKQTVSGRSTLITLKTRWGRFIYLLITLFNGNVFNIFTAEAYVWINRLITHSFHVNSAFLNYDLRLIIYGYILILSPMDCISDHESFKGVTGCLFSWAC